MPETRKAAADRPFWNILIRTTDFLGAKATSLDTGHLLKRAQRETGLEDFGGSDFMEPMEQLISDFLSQTGMDPVGKVAFSDFLLGRLRNRLRMREWVRCFPEIKSIPISRPVFVVGLPRTGTTILQGLLGELGGTRILLGWENAVLPLPSRSPSEKEIKAAFRTAEKGIAGIYHFSPGLLQAHEGGAGAPEECSAPMMNSFRSLFFDLMFDCPRYCESVMRSGFAGAYEWHKLQLQILNFTAKPKTWVLKCPYHLGSLPALLRVYPDACVVFTHRNPLEALPSMAGLTTAMRSLCSPWRDPVRTGRQTEALWSRLYAEGSQARRNWPDETPRFFDVSYQQIVANPLGVLESIRTHFGLEATDGYEKRIGDYLAVHKQHRHGRHRYTLEEYGMSEPGIRAAFQEEFGILEGLGAEK